MEDILTPKEGMDQRSLENIASLKAQGYESPDLKKRRNFKFYNNTFIYVSFRDGALEKNKSHELVKDLFRDVKDNIKTLGESDQYGEIGLSIFKLYNKWAILNISVPAQ